MNSLTQNKTLMGVIILAAFLILGFLFYSWSTPSLGTATNSDSGKMGQALLVTLAGLNTIHLDGEIFTDPVFISLTDFGVAIPSQPAGRRNPFLPIGSAN